MTAPSAWATSSGPTSTICCGRGWARKGASLKLGVQFRSPFLRGRTTTAHGTVTAVRPEGNDVLVDLEVWTIDDEGNKMAPGTATVAVPSRS